MGTSQERRKLDAALAKCCKALRIALPSEGALPSELRNCFERMYRKALVKDASYWLANKGASPKGPSSGTVSHVASIPLGLVEECLVGNSRLVEELGIEGGVPSGRAQAKPGDESEFLEDAGRMLSLLRKEGNTLACVPLEIDPETGMGFYILGSDFTCNIDDDLKRKLFGAGNVSEEGGIRVCSHPAWVQHLWITGGRQLCR